MKKSRVLKLALLSILSAVTVVSLSACEEPNPSSGSQQQAIEGITISSENNVRTIQVGQTLQLTAKVFPLSAAQTVTWSTSDSAIATINETGLVNAVAVGNVQLVATSTVDASISQSFALIVEEAEEVVIAPETITITAENDATSLQVGGTLQLNVSVTPENASDEVEWTVSDTTIASVSRRGLVTGLKVGEVTVTATSTELSTVLDTYTLTIEEADGPIQTQNWEDMACTSHETYMTAENDTPLKVKGIVTHVTPVNTSKNTVNYYIQNGTEGYYVYAQDTTAFTVEEGKCYEVGGFKKYYQGLNEIVNVEYFVESSESFTATVSSIEGKDVTSKDEMSSYHSSLISGKAKIESVPSIGTKAFSVSSIVNEKTIDIRVDPATVSAEDFAELSNSFASSVPGTEFTFKAVMSAFGYGTPKNQINILKASDVEFEAISDSDFVGAAKDALKIATSLNSSVDSIELPTSLPAFDGVAISWASDNSAINAETGAVTHSNEDVVVTLTATLTKGSTTLTKEIKVTILGNVTYTDVATLDLEDAAEPNQYGNSETKSSYAEAVVELGTPANPWMLRNALIAATSNDKYDGKMSIRIKNAADDASTGRIQIMTPGEYNYVQFDACVYGGDAEGITLAVAYSTDNGTTWTTLETTAVLTSRTLETYRFTLPEGEKLVAIYVVAGSGNRANIDNIRLMK